MVSVNITKILYSLPLQNILQMILHKFFNFNYTLISEHIPLFINYDYQNNYTIDNTTNTNTIDYATNTNTIDNNKINNNTNTNTIDTYTIDTYTKIIQDNLDNNCYFNNNIYFDNDTYIKFFNFIRNNKEYINETLYKLYNTQNITELYEIIDIEKFILIIHTTMISILMLLYIICFVKIVSPNKNKNTTEDFPNNFKDYEAYEDVYLKAFQNQTCHVLSSDEINNIKNKHICEETPTGKVIMYYDFETKSFNYYCENKNSIPYLHLETVAQRFTIENDCKILFTDSSQEESTQGKSSQEESTQEKSSKSSTVSNIIQENKPSIFANLKTYNNKAPSTSNETSFEAKDTLKKKANHFKYCGKLNDFNLSPSSLSSINNTVIEDKHEEQNTEDKPVKEDQQNTEDKPVKEDKSNIEQPIKQSKKNKLQPKNNLTFAEYKKLLLEES